MRDTFNLVRGAVSERDLIPVLTHFAYFEGRIHGYNGRVHLSAPVKMPASMPSFTVPADLLMAALDSCRGEPKLVVVENQLRISEGSFQANLPIGSIADFIIPPAPVVPKKAKYIAKLLPILRTLRPFVGEDASRPWCASIRFDRTAAFATNNVVLASLPLPAALVLKPCALPLYAIEELLRIDLEPVSVILEENHALWFILPGDVHLRSHLITEGWPDAAAMLASVHTSAQDKRWAPIDPELAQAVETVTPFCPDTHFPAIVLAGDTVKTREGSSRASVSGFRDLEGSYHAQALEVVLSAATDACWSCYPRVPWVGANGLKGVLIGVVA